MVMHEFEQGGIATFKSKKPGQQDFDVRVLSIDGTK